MDHLIDVGFGFVAGFVTGAAMLYVYLYRAIEKHGKAIADEIRTELEKERKQ